MDEPNNPITLHHTAPSQPDTSPSHSSTPILTSAQTKSHAQMIDSHTLIPINNSSQTMSTHPMVTCAKAGIFKPLERINCHVTTTSSLPRSHVYALRDPHWKEAMLDEYNALFSNGTWVLIPHPTNVNVVRSMWLFKHKFKAYESLSRYKARLVANGRSQQQAIDCDETFSLVVKPTTIRTILSLAVSRDWPIHQLDVKNAFLHGHLSETVYMHQPPGFVDPNKPSYVCHLQRSLYGLKQAQRAWFQRFVSYATRVGFQHSKTNSILFVFHRGSDIDYLLLYMDDIILTASSSAFLQRIIASLHSEFAMTDLGSLNYFLVYCDNVSAVYMSANPVQHQRTKHIEIDVHFVHDFVASGQVRVLHVPSRFQRLSGILWKVDEGLGSPWDVLERIRRCWKARKVIEALRSSRSLPE
nr:ribonuclease H-like domain-containing protein [Tanacetum cinerariifolium]